MQSVRLRFDISASSVVSGSSCGEVAAVDEPLPFLDMKLSPLRVLLELLPLLRLAVSEGPVAPSDAALVVVIFGGSSFGVVV